MALWNAQSMMNKTTIICDFIQSEHLDVLALTEAWFKGDARDNHAFAAILNTLPGYKIHSLPRPSHFGKKGGGGICVILREGYVTEEKKHGFQSFECLELSITSPIKEPLKFVVIYRSPSNCSKIHPVAFFQDFNCLLESVSLCTLPLVICGDFNFHMDNPGLNDTKTFNEILTSAGLVQLVSEPTHVAGHWLDLIITNESNNCIGDVHVMHTMPKTYFAGRFSALLARPPPPLPGFRSSCARSAKLMLKNFVMIFLQISQHRATIWIVTLATTTLHLVNCLMNMHHWLCVTLLIDQILLGIMTTCTISNAKNALLNEMEEIRTDCSQTNFPW